MGPARGQPAVIGVLHAAIVLRKRPAFEPRHSARANVVKAGLSRFPLRKRINPLEALTRTFSACRYILHCCTSPPYTALSPPQTLCHSTLGLLFSSYFSPRYFGCPHLVRPSVPAVQRSAASWPAAWESPELLLPYFCLIYRFPLLPPAALVAPRGTS